MARAIVSPALLRDAASVSAWLAATYNRQAPPTPRPTKSIQSAMRLRNQPVVKGKATAGVRPSVCAELSGDEISNDCIVALWRR